MQDATQQTIHDYIGSPAISKLAKKEEMKFVGFFSNFFNHEIATILKTQTVNSFTVT